MPRHRMEPAHAQRLRDGIRHAVGMGRAVLFRIASTAPYAPGPGPRFSRTPSYCAQRGTEPWMRREDRHDNHKMCIAGRPAGTMPPAMNSSLLSRYRQPRVRDGDPLSTVATLGPVAVLLHFAIRSSMSAQGLRFLCALARASWTSRKSSPRPRCLPAHFGFPYRSRAPAAASGDLLP